jgi:putative hydrolase of the HAD superfamily
MAVEAVIWDFGGVFTTSPFDAFNRYERERGLPVDIIRKINSINPDTNAWAKIERSEVDAATFDKLFADEARAIGHDIRGADVLALLSGDLRPAVVAAPTGKGAGMSSSSDKAQQIAEVFAQFDHVIESSKATVRKPDPRIYQMMCDALNVRPAACVYLDDLGINLKPAREMGMTTIKVVSEARLLNDLSRTVGIPF